MKITLDRRAFLKTSAMYAVTLSVPATLWGCNKNKTTTNSGANHKSTAAWEAKAQQLESTGVLTTDAPGKWDGKAGSHVPQVSFQQGQGTVTIHTAHGMSPEHYITAHYIRDQDGKIIGMKEYTGNESDATAVFTLPPKTVQITAYSHCNLHDHWAANAAST